MGELFRNHMITIDRMHYLRGNTSAFSMPSQSGNQPSTSSSSVTIPTQSHPYVNMEDHSIRFESFQIPSPEDYAWETQREEALTDHTVDDVQMEEDIVPSAARFQDADDVEDGVEGVLVDVRGAQAGQDDSLLLRTAIDLGERSETRQFSPSPSPEGPNGGNEKG